MKPEFDQAIINFQEFLDNYGAPKKIVWIAQEHTLCLGREWLIFKNEGIPQVLVKARYQQARDMDFGLRLCLLCHDGDHSYCYLYVPVDEEDAEQHLSLNACLKMSVPQPMPEAKVVSRGLHIVWYRFRELKYRQWKKSFFRVPLR